MSTVANDVLHDAYAAEYDEQVRAYDCHIADVLFGLTFEFTQPGQVLLDIGIGSGFSSLPFARAGLEIHGMDFSSEFLKLCGDKGFCASLTCHDITDIPWPYPVNRFHHVVCCGVLHFIADLEGVISETSRVIRGGGWFAFTTRVDPKGVMREGRFTQQTIGGFEICNHSNAYLDSLLKKNRFDTQKVQKCFVGEDVFTIRVARKLG